MKPGPEGTPAELRQPETTGVPQLNVAQQRALEHNASLLGVDVTFLTPHTKTDETQD